MSKKENKEEKDTVLAEDVEKVAEDAAKEKVDEAKGTAADEGADKKAPDAKDAAAKAEADKAAKLQQQFVRLQADFANYKKRTAAEKLQISEVVKMDVITNILPVIDNFERALQVPQDIRGAGHPTIISLSERLQMKLRCFQTASASPSVNRFN